MLREMKTRKFMFVTKGKRGDSKKAVRTMSRHCIPDRFAPKEKEKESVSEKDF